MSVLALVQPLAVTAIAGTLEGAARLASPSPREAAVSGVAGARTIDVDLGAVVTIDALFLGYTSLGDGASFTVTGGAAGYAEQQLPPLAVATSRLANRQRHCALVLAQPVAVRYLRLAANLPAGSAIGVFAAGLAIRPASGHELGGGRFVTDTGVATRTFGGGFGFSPGARAGGWSWTLPDLSDAEVDAIYGLQLDAGGAATVLVVEDPDLALGLNERIHWGRLTQLQPYERQAPGMTKWEMRIEDWAAGVTSTPATPTLTNTRANSTAVRANASQIAPQLLAMQQQIAARGG